MEGHVHQNLDQYGYCESCGQRVMTTFRGFPLPDRPHQLVVNHKYPFGLYCTTHGKYQHEEKDDF